MTTLILVRHAQSAPDFERPEREWPLSALGVEQAEQLIARFEALLPIDRIYSSPYDRALATVRPLSRHTGIPIEVRDDLRERKIAPGPIPDFVDVIERSYQDFDFALPGCESSRATQQRGVAAIASLVADNPNRTLVISSHGQLLSLFLNSRDPSFGFSGWRAMPFPHIEVLQV